MTRESNPEHVRQVAEIVDLVVNAFILMHRIGAKDGVCCDAALSSFVKVVSIFQREKDTIDALPLIIDALQAHMQERLKSEADEREKQVLAEADAGTVH